MSIVIKGMDMPTSCSRCPCSNDASRFCRVVEEYIPMLGKPAFCPLVDVPDTNVGDMINRRAVIDDIKAMYEWHDVVTEDRLIEHMKRLPSAQPELGKNSPSEQHKMDKLGVKTEETCTDIISRQAAIDAILECCTSDFDNEYECGYDDGLRQGVHRLKHLPSAQPDVPDRKVGKWIEEVGMLMCSECGDAWGTEQFDEVMSFNFCPNCGAKMEGRDE